MHRRHPVSLGPLLPCDSRSFIPCLSEQTCRLPWQAVRAELAVRTTGWNRELPSSTEFNWGLTGTRLSGKPKQTAGRGNLLVILLKVYRDAQDCPDNVFDDAASWRWVRRSSVLMWVSEIGGFISNRLKPFWSAFLVCVITHGPLLLSSK